MEWVSISGVDVCRALFVYDGAVREVVTRLKYQNDRRALGRLADGLAGLLLAPPGAVVTWIPTTGVRRRRRGFDQAGLLARAVARRWSIPSRSLLRRVDGPAQTGRSLVDRRQGVAVVARASAATYRGRPVILVDDVVTTGATLRSGAAALRLAGIPWIGAVAVARTPRSR